MQRAHRARVVIVSPSLMMMAIEVTQTLVRDAAMRDEARAIQGEVGRLLKDVAAMIERAAKLETHFRQAQEDVGQIGAVAERIERRAGAIEAMDFARERGDDAPQLRLAAGGE